MFWMPGLPYLSQNSNIAGILQDYDVKSIWNKNMIISCKDLILLISSSIETFGVSKNSYEIIWQLDFFYLIYSGKAITKLSSHK